MRPASITRTGLVLVAALLLAACGGPDATDTTEGAPGQPEQADAPAAAPGDAPSTVDREEAPGLDTSLPIYPGSVRIRYWEPSETSFIVTYVAGAPMDEVIAFYIDEIGSMPGVFHSEFPMGDGDYEFFLEGGEPLPDHPQQDSVFVLTLWDKGDTTEIQVMASVDFLE